MELLISQLIEYAVRKGWIEDSDRIWASNRILEALHVDGFDGLGEKEGELPQIQEILDGLCDYAYEHGVIEGNSATYRDLFDTALIGLVMPRPSEITAEFYRRYESSPKEATDWYYGFSGDTNYIRRDRIAKDRKWTVDTDDGAHGVKIWLSKSERHPNEK